MYLYYVLLSNAVGPRVLASTITRGLRRWQEESFQRIRGVVHHRLEKNDKLPIPEFSSAQAIGRLDSQHRRRNV
jgi:hypothetical protein